MRPPPVRRARRDAAAAGIALTLALAACGGSRAESPDDRVGAPALPTFRAVATVTAEGPSITVPVPGGVAPGDVLVASILALPSNDENRLVTADGWTFVRNTQHNWIYLRVAEDDEPATFTWSFELPGSKRTMGEILAFAGVDPDAPLVADAGTFLNQDRAVLRGIGTPTPAIVAPSVETPGRNALVLYFAACHTRSIERRPITDITPPPGMTEVADFEGRGRFETAYMVKGTPGPTGELAGRSDGISIHSVASVVVLADGPA